MAERRKGYMAETEKRRPHTRNIERAQDRCQYTIIG